MSGIAGKNPAADEQTRAPVVERAVHGEIAGVGELSFLVGAADPRGRIVELARVEVRGDTDVVPNAFADDTVNARSQLSPGRGNDAGFDLVAHDPVIGRRLVGFVEDAKWDEEQAAFQIHRVAHLAIQPGLFDLGLAVVVLADDRVLELNFGVEGEALIEAVVEAEHETLQIGRGISALAKLAVPHLTVADDIGATAGEPRAPVEHRAVVEGIRRSLLRRRGRSAGLGLEIVDFLLQDLQLLIYGCLSKCRCTRERGGQCQR